MWNAFVSSNTAVMLCAPLIDRLLDGESDDFGAAWRQADLDLVGSPRFQEYLRQEGFILIKWKDLAGIQASR